MISLTLFKAILLCMHNNYKCRNYQFSMQAERIKFLIEEIAQNPEEPFNHYALGLEYQKTKPQEAKELFEKVLHAFPDYLPVYYTAANHFFSLDENEKADQTFKKGITLAIKQNNQKAERELKGSYTLFLDEIDD